MRYISLLIVGILVSCGTDSARSDRVDLLELEKKGFETYQESPSKAIEIFKQVAVEYEKRQDFKKAGITNLNIANIYDERLKQVDYALIYAEKSLEIWKTLNDTMQMANLLKYTGMLKGRSSQFDEAYSNIRSAMVLYKTQEFPQGVAVSQFNLADMYYRMEDYERSIKHLNSSTDFWGRANDMTRVYTNNILGIKVYSSKRDYEKVDSLIKENVMIERETNINEYSKGMFDDLVSALEKEERY